jgi:hypothetical protein
LFPQVLLPPYTAVRCVGKGIDERNQCHTCEFIVLENLAIPDDCPTIVA